METLYQGQFFTVDIDRQKRAVRLQRSSLSSRLTPETSADQLAKLQATFDEITGASTMRILIDVRSAVGRNDEEFEQRVLPVFIAIIKRFEKSAVHVSTPIGKMQMGRLAREHGLTFEVFVNDEPAAARFLDA